jgi:hypothetical protein
VTAPWVPDPPGARPSETTCRGCGTSLYPLDTDQPRWEDANGITVCVKAGTASIGRGLRPDYVFHQPMPAGLRGAPDWEEGTDG